MRYIYTPMGFEVHVTAKDDPWAFEKLTEIMDLAKEGNKEANVKVATFKQALYYCDIGFLDTDEVESLFAVASPEDQKGESTDYVLLLPSPTLCYMHGDRAPEVLEDFCQNVRYSVYDLDDDEFMDMYDAAVTEMKDEDVDDQVDVTIEDDDIKNKDDIVVESEKKEDKRPAPQDDEAPNTKKLYRLIKAADVYKFKKAAKAFYMVGGVFFFEPKPKVIFDTEGIKLQPVNMKYAVNLSPSKI